MAIHKDFPKSPYVILDPNIRWFPAEEDLRSQGYDKLLPPLVDKLRRLIKQWRDSGYQNASSTSRALLKYWFDIEHPVLKQDGASYNFQYYFAQREAVETIIYLYEIAKVKDKYDLMRFDSSGSLSAKMFAESWKRFVIKMATGSGKTKVMSLILAWSYFHKLYEDGSTLARNFLIIAPNIIVLARLRTDFDGLKIFFNDPVLPPDGFEDRNWKQDFQLTLHIQDDLNVVNKLGNIFLTNIHRVYDSDKKDPSFEDENTSDYFLGAKPVGATNDSKFDLGKIVRDIDELIILNDEAHHIHDERMAWAKSIGDIHNNLVQKGSELSLQVDFTATPRQPNGGIFVQTVSDYPLVEAIYQNIVKHPVLPDVPSRAKLSEKTSSKYSERYEDYIHLGYLEWKKVSAEHEKVGKKAVLFLMTDDTKNCDEVAEYLKTRYPEFTDSVLVIHTKENGELSEAGGNKNEEELAKLRKAANEIDHLDNPYKAIVSVLVLKEGWDVRSVTTIVGLRAYTSKSNILPEQTLGRGLRRMYHTEQGIAEFVSVIGTDAFMEFVESIKTEGVELELNKMGSGTPPKSPTVIEIDVENPNKDIEKLDIQLPVLTPRIFREYKNLSELDVSKFGNRKLKVKNFTKEEMKEIIFKDIVTDDISHSIRFDWRSEADYRTVVGFFTQIIMKELRLISGYDILYEKVKSFIQNYLFDTVVDLKDPNVLRNLSEVEPNKILMDTFKKQINELTIVDKGEAQIQGYIRLSKCRPFVLNDKGYMISGKSVFNKFVVGTRSTPPQISTRLQNLIEYGRTQAAEAHVDGNRNRGDKDAESDIPTEQTFMTTAMANVLTPLMRIISVAKEMAATLRPLRRSVGRDNPVRSGFCTRSRRASSTGRGRAWREWHRSEYQWVAKMPYWSASTAQPINSKEPRLALTKLSPAIHAVISRPAMKNSSLVLERPLR